MSVQWPYLSHPLDDNGELALDCRISGQGHLELRALPSDGQHFLKKLFKINQSSITTGYRTLVYMLRLPSYTGRMVPKYLEKERIIVAMISLQINR